MRLPQREAALLPLVAPDGVVCVLAHCPSTMDVARELMETTTGWGVVLADEQRAGRGRQGREWLSPRGGLYTTVLLPTIGAEVRLEGLSLVVGMAIIEALRAVSDAPFLLKWPNDVLDQQGKKLAGVLIEVVMTPEGSRRVLVGIGMNLNVEPLPRATALSTQGKTPEELLQPVVRNLRAMWLPFQQGGFEVFRERWLQMTVHGPHEPLAVDVGSRVVRGGFAGVDGEGALLLATPGEQLERVVSGHVVREE